MNPCFFCLYLLSATTIGICYHTQQSKEELWKGHVGGGYLHPYPHGARVVRDRGRKKKKVDPGRGGRETGWRASLLGQTAELKNGYKAGSPKPSYNQTAPEQGPSANPCPPAPLPAFGVLWEGMVEAAWRGLL